MVVLRACAVMGALGILDLRGAEASDTESQLRRLQQQNQAMEKQLLEQRALIESLSKEVKEMRSQATQSSKQLEVKSKDSPTAESKALLQGLGKVNLSAEGALAFFKTGREGNSPNSEFRVDEAKLFVEAPVVGNAYFFGELNLFTREAYDEYVKVGEIYLDVENVSQLWNRERMVNLRLGRMYIPFGEEYQNRYAIDNPLISHSLSDIWGVDEGIELYGRLGKFSYALAVQNGGASAVRDFTEDKSFAGRIGFDATKSLHLSLSAMRTGALKPPGDYWSELWFGNGWIIPFGSAQTTDYHAHLFEGDIEFRLPHGHLKAFGGYVRYNDNDSLANNARDIFYYSIEGVADITRKLYAGVRFSHILADKGFPIGGQGDRDDYVFGGELTESLWRLSLGLGYRWSPNLITKMEYSFECGKEVGGDKRDSEDLFALQAAFKF